MTTTFALKEISIDLVRQTALVGAEVTWRELLAATSGVGLTGLAGSNANSGVVADTLGGGPSWFGRAFGTAENNVLGLDIVDHHGRIRRVGPAADPQVFRAIRGGSESAAVVAMEVTLHRVPLLCGGRLLWPIEMAQPVLDAFSVVTQQAPDGLTAWAQLLRFPDLPDLPKVMRGSAFIAIDVVFLGPLVDADVQLAPFRRISDILLDTVGSLALRDLPTMSAEPFEPFPTIDFCRFLTHLDSQAVRSLLTAVGPNFQSSLVMVQLRHLGGALQSPRDGRGRTGATSEPYELFGTGVPFTPEIAADIELELAMLTVAMDPYLSDRTLPGSRE